MILQENFTASSAADAHTQIYMRGLLAGFALVAILILILSSYSIYSGYHTRADLNAIVNAHGRHIDSLLKLEMVTQKRTRLFFDIIQTSDPFLQDEKIQELSSEARNFILIFKQLQASPTLDGIEIDKLRQLGTLANESQQQIQTTLDLAIAGKSIEARAHLLSHSLISQSRVQAGLSDLINYNQDEIANIQSSAMARSLQYQRLLLFGGGLTLILTIVIAWRVWKLMQQMVNGLKGSHLALETSMRTMQFQQTAMNEHALVSITDPDGNIVTANDRFCTVSQYTLAELLGANHRILNSNYHPRSFFTEMWRTISSGKIWQGNIRNRRKDGSFFWVASTIVPFLDQHGTPYQYVSIRTDITPLLEAEQALIDQSLHIRAILDNMQGGVITLDAAGSITSFNKASENIFSYASSEVIGEHINRLMPIPQLTTVGNQVQQHDQLSSLKELIGNTHALTGIRKDGTLIPIEMVVSGISHHGLPVYICLLQDITLRKRAEETLIIARDEAQRANVAKSRFLSSISHDLRTPMNAILGFSQLLDLDPALPADQKEPVRQIMLAGNHLLKLIDDVLELSRLESGNLELHMENFEVSPLLDECMMMVGPQARARAVTLNHSCKPDTTVHADRTRLKQSLLNLLCNAIKYNKDGGNATLTVNPTDKGMMCFMVTDTGIGIPRERMSELFQPFSRLGAEVGGVEGTGIGLSITRNLVENMGGRIDASSEAGSGSSFWIELPCGT